MGDLEEAKRLLGEADEHLCTQSLIIDRQYIHDKLVNALAVLENMEEGGDCSNCNWDDWNQGGKSYEPPAEEPEKEEE